MIYAINLDAFLCLQRKIRDKTVGVLIPSYHIKGFRKYVKLPVKKNNNNMSLTVTTKISKNLRLARTLSLTSTTTTTIAVKLTVKITVTPTVTRSITVGMVHRVFSSASSLPPSYRVLHLYN